MNIIIFTLIFIFHFFYLNVEEKILLASNNAVDKRPICNNNSYSYDMNIPNSTDYYRYCYGTPSGHTEVTTILGILTVHYFGPKYYKFTIPLAVTTIILMGLQRIYSSMHNLYQVLMGFVTGCLYAILYIWVMGRKGTKGLKSRKSPSGTVFYLISTFVFLIVLFKILIVVKYRYTIENNKLPVWVNSSLYKDSEKKMNLSLGYFEILLAHYHKITYMTWNTFENSCDKLYTKVISTGYTPDIILGIKTGGAFMANYIGSKYNIPYTFIKIKSSVVNGENEYQKLFMYITEDDIYKSYDVIETPTINLTNKKILVVDEMCGTGNTMFTIINYLKTKNVGDIFAGVLFESNFKSRRDIGVKYTHVYEDSNTLFPWGYGN